MILHVISKSPYEASTLSQCLLSTTHGDGILLMQDGVYGINHQSIKNVPHPIYVIGDDLAARGLENNHAKIKSITYDEFVELCVQYESSISW